MKWMSLPESANLFIGKVSIVHVCFRSNLHFLCV